jgi:hypothetical protein
MIVSMSRRSQPGRPAARPCGRACLRAGQARRNQQIAAGPLGLGLSARHETCLVPGMANSAIALPLGQLNCTFCMRCSFQGGIVTACDAASAVRGPAEAPLYDHERGQV